MLLGILRLYYNTSIADSPATRTYNAIVASTACLFVSSNGKWYKVSADLKSKERIENKQDIEKLERGSDFSPDGKKKLVVKGSYPNEDLWIMNVDGSEARNLTEGMTRKSSSDGSKESIDFYSFSPDGEKVLLVTSLFEPTYSYYGTIKVSSFWIIDTDGSKREKILDGMNSVTGASFSPDGKEILFTQLPGPDCPYGALSTMSVDGSKIENLAEGTKDYSYPCYANYSHDGRYILFLLGSNEFGAIWIMNSDGSGKRLLVGGGTNSLPTLSPDNKKLLFFYREHRADPGYCTWYMISVEGTNKIDLSKALGMDIDYATWGLWGLP
jgi:Tol biopolymer transport system component